VIKTVRRKIISYTFDHDEGIPVLVFTIGTERRKIRVKIGEGYHRIYQIMKDTNYPNWRHVRLVDPDLFVGKFMKIAIEEREVVKDE